MGKLQRALGLMSGTSMDGIDVALLATDGNRELQHGPAAAFPYPSEIRLRLRNALGEAKSLVRREDRPGLLRDLERDLTLLNAEAVKRFLAANGIDRGTIDLVGYHGQTVLHDPARAMTVQLGDGALLSEQTGLDIVFDMRAADVAAGGQGAPLVPDLPPRPCGAARHASRGLREHRRRRQHHLDRRAHHRVRHRARKCASRRLDAEAHGCGA